MSAPTKCEICGRVHAADFLHGDVDMSMALRVANTNSQIVDENAPRVRLSITDAITRSKAEYEKTLAYLA